METSVPLSFPASARRMSLLVRILRPSMATTMSDPWIPALAAALLSRTETNSRPLSV